MVDHAKHWILKVTFQWRTVIGTNRLAHDGIVILYQEKMIKFKDNNFCLALQILP